MILEICGGREFPVEQMFWFLNLKNFLHVMTIIKQFETGVQGAKTIQVSFNTFIIDKNVIVMLWSFHYLIIRNELIILNEFPYSSCDCGFHFLVENLHQAHNSKSAILNANHVLRKESFNIRSMSKCFTFQHLQFFNAIVKSKTKSPRQERPTNDLNWNSIATTCNLNKMPTRDS